MFVFIALKILNLRSFESAERRDRVLSFMIVLKDGKPQLRHDREQ